jgi:hypothetical protein
MEEIELKAISNSSDLHRFILEGKTEKIQSTIDSNPNEKVAIIDGSSAIAMTLKCGTLEVYEILVINGFMYAPGESFEAILRNIDENPKVKSDMKVKLKEIHRKYMKESTKQHLFKLNLMAKLALTTPEDKRQEFEEVIASTFEELNKIAEVEKFMKYVASARGESLRLIDDISLKSFVGFQFYFDFGNTTIAELNPEYCSRTIYGLTCPVDGCIYIAAKLLLDPPSRFKVHGTLVHEMVHQSMNMLHNNDCKPYKKNDKQAMEEYKEAVKQSKRKDHNEDIFARALVVSPDEDDDKQEAEAIVRPAHVTALYANDATKREEIEANYPELYDFYRNRVLPDIDQALKDADEKAKNLQKKYKKPLDVNDLEYLENIRKLKCKKRLLWIGSIFALLAVCGTGCFFYFWMYPMNQIESINDEFFSGFEYLQLTEEVVRGFNISVDTDRRVLHFKSNCVTMTILAIRQFLKKDNSLGKSFFVNFDVVTDESTGKKFRKLHESLVSLTMIVNCSGVDLTRLSSLIGSFSSNRIILVLENSKKVGNFSSFKLNHSWSQLTKTSQQRILNKIVDFQGFNATIGEISLGSLL